VFAGKKSAQIREILISESAWEEMTCLFAPSLSDTPFSDEAVIQEHIDAGITLANAVNFLVEKYELVRIDRCGFSSQVQAPYLTATDILHARKACGLMSRYSYREVSNIVLSRSRI